MSFEWRERRPYGTVKIRVMIVCEYDDSYSYVCIIPVYNPLYI